MLSRCTTTRWVTCWEPSYRFRYHWTRYSANHSHMPVFFLALFSTLHLNSINIFLLCDFCVPSFTSFKIKITPKPLGKLVLFPLCHHWRLWVRFMFLSVLRNQTCGKIRQLFYHMACRNFMRVLDSQEGFACFCLCLSSTTSSHRPNTCNLGAYVTKN